MRATYSRWRVSVAVLALASATAWASPPAGAPGGEPLYFALELKKSDGKVVGTPKVVGMEGKTLRVEKRRPNADSYDYRVVLQPSQAGEKKYDVALDFALPGLVCHYDVQLLHGKVQKFAVGPTTDPVQVELTLLQVDSPEFRALMELKSPPKRRKSI